MNHGRLIRTVALLSIVALAEPSAHAQPAESIEALVEDARAAMEKATRYMVETVSTGGGYVWYYTTDLSRRWGEMEAYPTMIWVQPPGTTSMGHRFLDAYEATGNRYYLQAAERAASALIWGQLPSGGWNYIVDFAGDRSLENWYDTIGKNGWRLEEFQHYYGNATFDDDVSSDAARFLLRMYLAELEPKYKPALDKAIAFILESQYPAGGWPQRYPLRHDFSHHGKPDYTSYYTFNDDVVWENVNFLLQCYLTLGEKRLLDPIRRGMNFYLITQQGPPQAGWAQQYAMDMKPAGARTYEPNALLPRYTAAHVRLLMTFYRLSGEAKFVAGIPAALDWLDRARLPESMTDGERYTHSTFVELGTNKPLFVHRKGSNVVHGFYYVDNSDAHPNAHYGMKSRIDVAGLRREYETLVAMPVEEAVRESPLMPGRFPGEGLPQHFYDVGGRNFTASEAQKDVAVAPSSDEVRTILAAQDAQGRWLARHVYISNPYVGDGVRTDPTDAFASTNVGDETDTSPFRDDSDTRYISTREYIDNMAKLIAFVQAHRTRP